MKNTEQDTSTRERILKTATDLFYEQGYKKTLFAHIAKELGITKGLITYHFGTKASLAQEIHTNLATDIHNEISFQIYSKFRHYFKYEPKLLMSVSQLCTLHMYKEDEKARRFYIEYMADNLQFSIEQTFLPFYFEQKRKHNRRELENSEFVRMEAFAERGARAVVILGYFRDKLDLSFEELVDYSLSINYRLERVSETKSQELIEQAKQIFEDLSVRFEPYFKIKID